jgi:hypothetical protein
MKRSVMVIGEVSAGSLFTSLISSPRATPRTPYTWNPYTQNALDWDPLK